MATRFASRARAATTSGGHSPSEAVEWQCRSTCAVRALRGRPRGLGLAEQLQQLTVRELAQRRVRIPAADRCEPCEPAAAGGTSPALEHQAELVLSVHAAVTGRGKLPALAVHEERSTGGGHAQASAAAVRGTADQSSQASGA